MKHYKLTDETITLADGTVLHRIECIEPIESLKIKVGKKGGFIEKESNLMGNAWVSCYAKVYGNAIVTGDALVDYHAEVYGHALVSDHAQIFGHAKVYDRAAVGDYACVGDSALVYGHAKVYCNAVVIDYTKVFGDACVTGNAEVTRNAKIESNSDYIVFKNWWSSGRFFTWTRSNNMWKVGCFHGTGDALIDKAYEDGEESGREYERIVRYVESVLKDEEEKQ